MTAPATILLGAVRRERLSRDLDDGEGILFERVPQAAVPEGASDAILVVVEPDQDPREVAEMILWALR